MPLSWNEIRSRAIAFSKEWGDETSERAEAQSFWNAFFTIFGIDRRRVTAFEKQVGMSRAGHALKNGRRQENIMKHIMALPGIESKWQTEEIENMILERINK